jgi:hypothetical protein
VAVADSATPRPMHEKGVRAVGWVKTQRDDRGTGSLSAIGDAVRTTDLEGRVTYMTPVAESLAGVGERPIDVSATRW